MAQRKKILVRTRKLILEMVGNGHTMTHICDLLGFSRTTEWDYRQKNPEYRKDLEDAFERRIEMVEDSLYAKAVGGDVQAIKFFLTNRSSKQWQNENFIRHTGETPGEPVQVAVREIIVEIPKSALGDDEPE